MQSRTRKLTVIALLSALAYIVMLFGRVPVVLFLKYDPKDVIITIGGFLFGPLTSFAISAVVSFVEMLSVSETGPIGFIMNLISTCAFACTAAFIYKRQHTMRGAVIGLVSGWLFSTAVMLLWNYFITPLYMGVPRAAVARLLIPAILPFNLLKGGLNAAITMLLYKPVKKGLLHANLVPESDKQEAIKIRLNIGTLLVSLFVIATCVMAIFILQGRI